MDNDTISRQAIKEKLQEHYNFFVDVYGGFENMPSNIKLRVDEITNCIAEVVNMPAVQRTRYEKELQIKGDNVMDREKILMLFDELATELSSNRHWFYMNDEKKRKYRFALGEASIDIYKRYFEQNDGGINNG